MSKTFRFNVLSNDVDLDDWITAGPSREKPSVKPQPEPAKKAVVKPNQKTVKKKQEKDSLRNLAFGSAQPKKKAAAGAAAPVVNGSNGSQQQQSKAKKSTNNDIVCNGVERPEKKKALSEDWKNRDQQFVEEENERELREALMLSKLDYEANKKNTSAKDDPSKPDSKNKKKKKDKPITLSLSDFNTLDTKKLTALQNGSNHSKTKSSSISEKNVPDGNFFDAVDTAVRNTITKESRQKQYAEQQEKQKMSRSETPSTGGGLLVSVKEVETRDFEIQALRLEVLSLKDQLDKVKHRNKKLCEVLGAAEMRSVGEVVIELSKVTKARDEFSAEVASLSEQLEQEKTKVSQLQEKHRKK